MQSGRDAGSSRSSPLTDALRRLSGILGGVLTALLILALAGVLYTRLVAGYSPAPDGLVVLYRGEAALVEAAAEVLFPAGAGLPVAGIDARLVHYVDRHLAALPRIKRLQIRALFMFFENLSLVIPGDGPGGRRRFSSLTVASRLSILEKVSNHSNLTARMLFLGLRAELVLGYLGHPANLRELGLAPFEIEHTVSDAELLFPRIGGLVSSIEYELDDRNVGTPRPPLNPHGPRHRAYARSSRDTR